jgi:hypothetical protein
MGGKGDRPAGLENRWWVDQQKDADGHLIDRPRVPLRFFRSAIGFDQDRAQRRLTDLNLKWFGETETVPGGWAMIHTLENQRVPEPRVNKVKAALQVPPDGRAILVDSGEALRGGAAGRGPHRLGVVVRRLGAGRVGARGAVPQRRGRAPARAASGARVSHQPPRRAHRLTGPLPPGERAL